MATAAAAPQPELRTVAVQHEVTAVASGSFAGNAGDNCVASVEGGRLRLWSAPGNGKPPVERAEEALPAAVHCLQAVRYGGVEMLFVLHAGMRWRLLQHLIQHLRPLQPRQDLLLRFVIFSNACQL